ncbi:E3 6.3 kDa protein [Human mastadenovirus E]|uniref:E3 6.3 kDa protein n=3 Tax=Human mastadenovirus E TaxID=130308 RepID=Q8BEL3_ADE04|nr:E3 6.3 kDa protein [Human adenovirus E4]AVQ69383.1 E3 6.3 kDa protein [Human mastadenovirus E]BAU59122.1 CR1-gamma/6.3 kDa protein [Human adenovirus 4p]AAT97461.1 E3 6.3 kDa protein [Human adenovirus E4]AAT97509.1 E3 6.3 kDa protein [Human adenovirus E4]
MSRVSSQRHRRCALWVSSYNHLHVHFCLLLQKASPTEIRPTAEPLCLIFDFPEP